MLFPRPYYSLMKNEADLLPLPIQIAENELEIERLSVSFTKSLLLHVSSLQFLSMLLLTSQQTLMPLLVRSASKDHSFLASTSVFLMEIFKIIVCLSIIFWNEGLFWKPFAQKMQDEILDKGKESLKVGVPAFVYALQNNLYYVALANVDATTYSVTYQLRILTTAILAVLLLQKRLSAAQWVALLCSLIGVISVQLDGNFTTSTVKGNLFLGVSAAFSMSWTSAFAGVYFEKMLKKPNADMWIQNLRLSLMTLLFAAGGMWLNDGNKILAEGFFQGWTPLLWMITVINSIGGLAVSAVMKYADNVKKTYCQTIAIVLTAVISISLGERTLTGLLTIGVGLVVTSVYVFALYPPEKERKKEGYRLLLDQQKIDETV